MVAHARNSAKNIPWKHLYGSDLGYTRRVDAARLREAAHVCGPTCKANRVAA
jgi:hypothetical protein